MKILAVIMALVVSVQVQAAAVCKIPVYDQTLKKYDTVLERVSTGGGVIENGLSTGRMTLACIVIEDLLNELNAMDKEFKALLNLLASTSTTDKYASACGMTQSRMDNLTAMLKEVDENNVGIIEVLNEYKQQCK